MGTSVRSLDNNQIRCRVFGHSWEEVPYTFVYARAKSTGGIRLAFRCTRACGTVRREVWNRNGRVEIRDYRYDPNYRFEGETMKRDTFRVEYLRRRSAPVSGQRATKARKSVKGRGKGRLRAVS